MNVKLSNFQLDKWKSELKNGAEVTLKLSSNVVGDSNDKINFPHKFLWNNMQVSRLPKSFTKGPLTKTKLSKTQLHKAGQSEGSLGRSLGPLQKTNLSLMKNLLKPLAKRVFIPLGLTAALSATDAAIQRSIFVSGKITLIISSEEMSDIMKAVKYHQEPGLLIKGVSETIHNEGKEQKEDYLVCY